MAGLAAVARIDMGGVLAGGSRAVVAARAAACDASMVERRWQPGGGLVAGFAAGSCRDMARWLADSLHVVVAGCAATQRLGVLEIDGGGKGAGVVAGLAALRAENMARGLRRRVDARAFGMTGGALARRPLENGVHVARLTRGNLVFAFELKAGSNVIESGIGRRSIAGNARGEQQEQGDQNSRKRVHVAVLTRSFS